MDTARNAKFWEVVGDELPRASMSCKGKPLSDQDSSTFACAIAMWGCCLMDIHSSVGVRLSDRAYKGWATSVATIPTHELAAVLSDVLVELRSTYAPRDYLEFKRQVASKHFGVVMAPVRTVLEDFLQNPNAETFALLNGFVSYPTHLNLRDIDLEGELVDQYLADEEFLRGLVYPSWLIEELNAILREWLRGFSLTPENFFPEHGPNATAELSRGASLVDKYAHLACTPMLEYVVRKHVGTDISDYYPQRRCNTPWVAPPSVFVAVPKSMKTMRVICKEPTTYLYFQKGVQKALYAYIEAHPQLGRHVNFGDQSLNGLLALEGSADGRHATIDLSSASDFVTYPLVKRLFAGTSVLPFLVATRSKSVVMPTGLVVEVAKFAPMGSALCFPVQTLVFGACCELAVRRARRHRWPYKGTWRAYGDDIICPDDLFEDVRAILTTLGFKLNRAKSYCAPSRFRESCGFEGFDGICVTPLRISRTFYACDPVKGRGDVLHGRHTTLLGGYVDAINAASMYSYHTLRLFLIRKLLALSPFPPLFSQDVERGIWSPNPQNFAAPRRWNTSLQRMEIRVGVLTAIPSGRTFSMCSDPVLEFDVLRRLAERPASQSTLVLNPVTAQRSTQKVSYRARWVQEPYAATTSLRMPFESLVAYVVNERRKGSERVK